MSAALGHVATDEAEITIESAPPTSDGCSCASADWCDKHDRVCPCADRFGHCRSSCKNCFGYISRDKGHKRVPAPPARITGTIISESDMRAI